jgi:hypothetical protein
MPTAYLTAADYTAYLGAYGIGATPSQDQAAALANTIVEATTGPHTLTGTFAVLVAANGITVNSLQRVILEGQITATNMAPGLSGQLHLELEMDGVPISADVIQSCDLNGTGVTANWKLAFVPPAGVHNFTLSAKGTGDNTLAVAAGAAFLYVVLT